MPHPRVTGWRARIGPCGLTDGAANALWKAQPTQGTTARDVAEGVWRAVHDTTGQLRLAAGADAVDLARNS